MTKQKLNRQLILRLQTSLLKDFQAQCDKNFKGVSEVIRDLMLQYVRDQKELDTFHKLFKAWENGQIDSDHWLGIKKNFQQ